MGIWINGKEVIDGATVLGSDYIAAGAGTPNVIDQVGGDIYITDGLEVDGTTTLDGALLAKSTVTVDAGVIATGTNTDLQLLPNGTGIVKIGDAGTPGNLGTPTNDDCFVSGRFEVDGGAFFDGEITAAAAINVADDAPVYLGTSADSSLEFDETGQAASCLVISADTTSKNVIIGDIANAGNDYDHAASSSPHLFVQSQTDPGSANDEWLSLTHNVTNGVIQVGSGNLTIGSGTTSNSLNANGDLMVSGKLEVDGISYFDGVSNFNSSVVTNSVLRCNSNSSHIFGTGSGVRHLADNTRGQFVTFLATELGSQWVIADPSGHTKDFGHVDAGYPVWYIHSEKDPDNTDQEYCSQAHDGDDAVFQSGHGGYVFGVPAQSARGTITFSGIPVADETIVINATTITFKADGSGDVDHCTIGADAAGCVTNLVATLGECSESANLTAWDGAGDTVVIEWGTAGTAGNSIVFSGTPTNVSIDGSGFLGGTHAGVAADTLLTLEEDAVSTFGGVVRADSSVWWHETDIAMYAIDPGASGATATVPDANTIGGYKLDTDTEYLYFQGEACDMWDGASDPVVTIHFECNVDNSGGNAGDTIDFDLVVYMKGVTDTASKSQSLSGSVTVGACAQYTMFSVDIAIDYDDGSNPVDPGDIINMRLNLDTTDGEVDDVVVNHIVFKVKTAKVGYEV